MSQSSDSLKVSEDPILAICERLLSKFEVRDVKTGDDLIGSPRSTATIRKENSNSHVRSESTEL